MKNKGIQVRDKVFNGDPYRQLGIMRKSIWALAVLNDNIESTEEEKAKAQQILEYSISKNKEVENILNSPRGSNDRD